MSSIVMELSAIFVAMTVFLYPVLFLGPHRAVQGVNIDSWYVIG